MNFTKSSPLLYENEIVAHIHRGFLCLTFLTPSMALGMILGVLRNNLMLVIEDKASWFLR